MLVHASCYSTPENPLVGVTREIKQFRTVDLQLQNNEMVRDRLWFEFWGKVTLALRGWPGAGHPQRARP